MVTVTVDASPWAPSARGVPAGGSWVTESWSEAVHASVTGRPSPGLVRSGSTPAQAASATICTGSKGPTTGGVVSTTVTVVVAWSVPPCWSSTVTVKGWLPMGTSTEVVAWSPTGAPCSSAQTKVSGSPSGSALALPSNVALAPWGLVHSRVWSAPASATGGSLGP